MTTKRARELEQKRSKGQVSCAECRRLKIKCDKQIPCHSCQRRGCASLCPNGSLATGQGTRFVLAATEHLHTRIAQLTARVHQLEDALAASEIDPPDPNSPPPPSDPIDAFGTLSISDHGVSRFFGPTGGSESLLLASTPSPPPPTDNPHPLPELALFSHSFPFTPLGHTPDIQNLILSYLPPWDQAQCLTDTYFEQVYWIFRGVTQSQLIDDTLPLIYRHKPPHPDQQQHDGPHDIALLFIVFAIASLVQPLPNPPQAEHFHQLSRAALALLPILEQPSIVTIQTLHLMSIYNAMSGSDLKSDSSMELTWSLITLASHLSQTIGLHRDSERWGLSHDVVQRRRILFWDLFVADVWQSLNTGRPPSFSLAYIDCRFPQYDHSNIDNKGTAFEIWQFRFAAECVADVTSRTLTAHAPSYTTIMELDRKIRQFPLPEGLCNPPPNNDLSATFMRCVLDHIKETVLMYLHRSFFAQAIMDHPLNPLKSPYAHSFVASYRAASTILKSVKEQFALFPNSCARFWTMWTFAFTAAVVFGTLVTRGPRSSVAQSAMTELDQALDLFTKASKYSIRALKALPILTRLADKARDALANVKASSAGHDWAISTAPPEHDELTIFAGHTRFVSSDTRQDKSNSEAPAYPYCQSLQVPLDTPSPESSYGYPQWSTEPIVLHPATYNYYPQEQQQPQPPSAPPLVSSYGPPQQQQQQPPPPQYYPTLSLQQPMHGSGTAADLADLGLASRDSRLDERWSLFMEDSGLLGGY